MNMPKSERKLQPRKLIEDVDYYFENGLMVLTARFLRERGFCCRNNCRHCPYKQNEQTNSQQKNG